MNFDTLMIETPCTCALHACAAQSAREVRSIEDVEYGTAKIPLDRNGRPVGISLDVAFDGLDRKLIEFYGESFRHKLNLERAKRGQKPL